MELDRLNSSSFSSHPVTHLRLKNLSDIAQSSEDHVSRIGLGLSLRRGAVDEGWAPRESELEHGIIGGFSGKQMKGKTLFKEELELWVALVLRVQNPSSYSDWRRVMVAHWERGVEELSEISSREGDWVRTLQACLQE